ncbi:type IV pili methyl-accepting chemotaxis transducer N-terminal domain-containing protein, partial [Leptospira borgpetersenii serovar Arborea]|nr:type IV pili methyl-accepting chemotaxis transducer N-terminal domain-containing protein [Leptospira borgpetersenii serovar Arborea]
GLGMGGMALAGWLAQGVQGSAHAINKAGSLRMQSYRLLAAVPVGTTRTDMFNEMERTAWSDELQQAAVRDGQQAALLAIQRYWRQHLAPALRDAHSPQEVSGQVTQFVGQIDALVSAFDSSTEHRIAQIVMLQRG